MRLLVAYFKQLPHALKKQILMRLVGATGSFALFLTILIATKEFVFSLPCLIFSAFLFVNLLGLLYNILVGSYVCVTGICEHIETTGFRKRIKSITVNFNGARMVLPIRKRMKQIFLGSSVTVYMSDKTPVYEKDGLNYAYEYYALEFTERMTQQCNQN